MPKVTTAKGTVKHFPYTTAGKQAASKMVMKPGAKMEMKGMSMMKAKKK